MFAVTLIAALYLVSFLAGPFPHWPTYFRLWQRVLFDANPHVTRGARIRQARMLLRYGLLSPVWTALWYLDDLLFPAYRKRNIRPVFIVGQPRSGTTLMHRTLAADTATFFAVRHIEWRFPFITVQKLLRVSGLAAKLAAKNYWPDTPAGQLASKMHPNKLSDWEEDGIFFEERMLHHFFLFLRFPYPELLPVVDEFDGLSPTAQRRFLGTHRKVLQKVMYLRGQDDTFYLSKEVTSHNKIPALMDLYPDARFLVVLRPSPQFMGSLLELVRNSTMAKTGIDPTTIPGWRSSFVERMRRDSRSLVNLCQGIIPEHLQVPVSSECFTENIPLVVRNAYARLGFSLRPEFAAHLEQLQTKQRTRRSGYDYPVPDLEGFEQFDQLVADVDNAFRRDASRGSLPHAADATAAPGAAPDLPGNCHRRLASS